MEDKKKKTTKDNKHYLKALMTEIEKSKKSKNRRIGSYCC